MTAARTLLRPLPLAMFILASAACDEVPLSYGDANSIIAVMPADSWAELQDDVYGALEPTITTVRAEKTFTVTYQNQAPGFRDDLPYVLAYVELEEGVQMLTNIVDCPPEEVRIGMPVEVTFEDVGEEVAVPRFRPRAS